MYRIKVLGSKHHGGVHTLLNIYKWHFTTPIPSKITKMLYSKACYTTINIYI